MRSIVLNYKDHFAALKFSNRFKKMSAEDAGGDYLDPDNSEMADWSGDREALTSPDNAQNLDALIEFLVSETRHAGLQVDPEKVEVGRALATSGDWKGELEGVSCTGCHATISESFVSDPDADNGGYPDLAGYGSAEWLRAFISTPGSGQFYGANNQMPSYANKMSEQELNLLVSWLTGQYHETEVKDYTNQKARVDEAMATRK